VPLLALRPAFFLIHRFLYVQSVITVCRRSEKPSSAINRNSTIGSGGSFSSVSIQCITAREVV